MQVLSRKKKDLIWYDTDTISYKPKVPILIDKDNNVLLGNSFRDSFEKEEEIKCIIINGCEYNAEALYALENSVVAEKSIERCQRIEYGIREYLRGENDTSENLSFFDLKVTDRITPENYIQPPPYNFHKGRKNTEGDNHPTLFDYEEELV